MMKYPELDVVERAPHVQLAKWYRFLPTPGVEHVGTTDFLKRFQIEAELMDRITNRLHLLGGITSEISKEIGWDMPA